MAFPPQVPTWEVYAGDDAAYTLTFTKERSPASLSVFTGFEACWLWRLMLLAPIRA